MSNSLRARSASVDRIAAAPDGTDAAGSRPFSIPAGYWQHYGIAVPALQRRAAGAGANTGGGAAAAAHSANQTGLPDGLKSGIERLSGLSLDDVRVHYDSP